MADEKTPIPDEPVVTPDSGEIEWAGTLLKKPPHAEDIEEEPADPEPDPLDEAERLGDDHYPG